MTRFTIGPIGPAGFGDLAGRGQSSAITPDSTIHVSGAGKNWVDRRCTAALGPAWTATPPDERAVTIANVGWIANAMGLHDLGTLNIAAFPYVFSAAHAGIPISSVF